jgi:hypothetical protein
MQFVAVLLPEAPGLLEWIFLGLLASLVGLVGLFSIYVIAQQFRNPGRGDRDRDRYPPATPIMPVRTERPARSLRDPPSRRTSLRPEGVIP